MKHFSLSWKIFFISIIFLSIPSLAWYASLYVESQLEKNTLNQNTQQLRMYHGVFQKLLNEDKDFAQQLKSETRLNQVTVAKRQGPIFLDGFFDEWYPYQSTAIQSRNDKKSSKALFVEDERFFYGLFQIQDNHLVYKNNPNDSQSSDMVRIDLGSGFWIFRAIAPGRINVLREHNNGFQILSSVIAQWQETQEGYQIEFRVPKSLVGDRVNLVLHDVDDPKRSDYQDNFQGIFTFTDFRYFPLSREKNTDWLLGNEIFQQRFTIINHLGQVVFQSGNLFQDSTISQIQLDSYAESRKLDNAFTRNIQSEGFSSEQVAIGDLNYIIRTGALLSNPSEAIGSIILERSLQQEKQHLQQLRWIGLILYTIVWIIVVMMMLRQIKVYRARIENLNLLTEQANENDLEVVDLTSESLNANDEIDQLFENLIYYNQRLEQRREHQQKLLARLNHELRTPLAIIGSSIDNLALTELESDDKQLIQNARSGLERLSLSFNRLSEANRLEESIDNVILDWFSLNSLLEKLTSAYSNTWLQQEFQLTLPENSIEIRGSEDLFAQMMDKIISNAVDFSEPGEAIKITLEIDNRVLKLSIANKGPTVESSRLKTMFNLMESNRSKSIPNKANLGLGLYIAKLVSKRHRAKILAVNAEDNSGLIILLSWGKKSYVVS